MASQCWMPGRIEAAVRYSDAGQIVLHTGRDKVPLVAEGFLGAAYLAIGRVERSVEFYRAQLARGRDTHASTRGALVFTLMAAGCGEEAMELANGLVDAAAEATRNPYLLSFALYAEGYAFRDADPLRALDALRRGVVVARESGNRANESYLSVILARLEAEHGDPLTAFAYFDSAIRNYHNSGNTTNVSAPLAALAVLFDRLERYEAAATIAGFANTALIAAWVPEIGAAIAHLRDVLGDQTYESLARKGEAMTTAAMATYAYEQIDQARTELERPRFKDGTVQIACIRQTHFPASTLECMR